MSPPLASPALCLGEGWHARGPWKSAIGREPPLSRDSEWKVVRCVCDELWPFWDRKMKIIGNPPFNRLNAQAVAEGLQFVLSATKLPLTIEPGAGSQFESRYL